MWSADMTSSPYAMSFKKHDRHCTSYTPYILAEQNGPVNQRSRCTPGVCEKPIDDGNTAALAINRLRQPRHRAPTQQPHMIGFRVLRRLGPGRGLALLAGAAR